MDRKEFLQTMGLGVTAAVVTPSVFFKGKDLIAGRVDHKERKPSLVSSYGGKLTDLRKTVRAKIDDITKEKGYQFNYYMDLPASVYFYRKKRTKVWNNKPIVAKTSVLGHFDKNSIYEEDNLLYFRYRSDAEKLYNNILNSYYTYEADRTLYAFYDMWGVCRDKSYYEYGDSEERVPDYKYTIYMRTAKMTHEEPTIIADEELTEKLLRERS